jgi:hypothetical protein
MTTISDSLRHEVTVDGLYDLASLYAALRVDFTEACARFAEARRQQQTKDTPAHRTAVLEGHAQIDAILDIYLDMHVELPGS